MNEYLKYIINLLNIYSKEKDVKPVIKLIPDHEFIPVHYASRTDLAEYFMRHKDEIMKDSCEISKAIHDLVSSPTFVVHEKLDSIIDSMLTITNITRCDQRREFYADILSRLGLESNSCVYDKDEDYNILNIDKNWEQVYDLLLQPKYSFGSKEILDKLHLEIKEHVHLVMVGYI